MNVYSVEIRLCATAYIKATSPGAAVVKAIAEYGTPALSGKGVEVGTSDDVSDLAFHDPDLPEVSLSPAMTAYGLWDAADKPELQEEDVP